MQRNRSIGTAIVAALLVIGQVALVALIPEPADAQATLLIVDSTGDGGDGNPGDGRCQTAARTCTLRAAIDEANANPGPDTISFAIPGPGVHTITIADTLRFNDPTGGTAINGYSQPGARANDHAGASNARILVEVTTTSGLAPMILIESAENTIRGLAIYGNGPRIELRGEQADGNVIAGNFIGTDATGTERSSAPAAHRAANAGVAMNLGPDRNLIGGPDRADRNVVSSNGSYGIRINHGETSENVIENNIVGLSPDLSRSDPQGIGIDLQWWTWGNYVTGNLVSGHQAQGIDLSHSAAANVVIANRIGTGSGGNGGNGETANRWGVTFKDNPVDNYVVDNVIGNSTSHGIWHRHNYTGANVVAGNRIGIGLRGADIGNLGYGMELRGHDDLYQDNIFANNVRGGVSITNTTAAPGPATNFPPEKTVGNVLRQNTFHNTPAPFIDIEAVGPNPNDPGDGDDGAHLLLNHPTITGVGPGQVFGQACAGCTVEASVGGTVRSDGTLQTDNAQPGVGAGWIGRAVADGQGRFSLAEPRLRAGKNLVMTAIDPAGNTSEFSPPLVVPATFQGRGSNPEPSLPAFARPAVPERPDPHQATRFDCRFQGGELTWDDAGVTEYYVFFTIDGYEAYLGPVSGETVIPTRADSYRVEHWATGFATNATCPGQGVPNLTCSYAAGVLSWTDTGAEEYYAFATTGGTERYLGPIRGTSVAADPADSYRVEHWMTGKVTNGRCR